MREFIAITKALGDESRVRAFLTLRGGELCLCQIIHVLGLAPSTVSRHMTELFNAGLVERRKQGRWNFYRITRAKASPAVRGAIQWATRSLRDDDVVAGDAAKLERIRRTDLSVLSACYA